MKASSLDLLLDKLFVDGFEEVDFIVDGLDKYFRVVHNPSEAETVVEVSYGNFKLEYCFDFHGVEHNLLARSIA